MYQRWLQSLIEEKLKYRRIVYVHGARQTGKTTLLRFLNLRSSQFFSLDDSSTRVAAHSEPQDFLIHPSGTTMIIDEIQKEPSLIEAMKVLVDRNSEKGQFLITGSSDVFSLPSVKESLAGRISTLKLRTMAQGEIENIQPIFIKNAFNGIFPSTCKEAYKADIIRLALTGGYPEVLDLPEKERKSWHLDYVQSLICKDAKDDYDIQKTDQLIKLVSRMAAWSGNYINIEGMLNELSISRPTYASYISKLEHMRLIDTLSSYPLHDYTRSGRAPKVYMNDTGLMSSLLNWDFDSVINNPERNGKLVETFVYNQIAAIAETSGYDEIHQYHDRDDREIVMIVSDGPGKSLFIEVKSGSNITAKSFTHIKWIMGKRNQMQDVGIVFHTGAQCITFGERLFAVPISALWS